MHYLIDGHNLIARMPGINLADPDDEAQLILRVRQWVAGDRRRRVTLYFDGGLPGGRAPHFSGGKVEVIFAAYGEPADDLIVRKIRRVHNPPEYTVVSSDNQIITAAARRRMPVIDADTFAAQLAADIETRQQPSSPPSPDVEEEPVLSDEDVAMWLELFGPEPDTYPPRPVSRRKRRGSAPDAASLPEPAPGEKKPEQRAARAARRADELKDSGAPLTDDEVAAWMALFGKEPDEAQLRQVREAARQARQRRREEEREQRAPARDADQLKDAGERLTADEVEEWLDIFKNSDV